MKTIASTFITFSLCLMNLIADGGDATSRKIDPKEYSTGQSDAQRDLKNGIVRYEIVGMPSQTNQELKKIAYDQYGISIVFHGCIVGPRLDYDQAYLETVISYLKKKYSFDPVSKIESDLRKKHKPDAAPNGSPLGLLKSSALAAPAQSRTLLAQPPRLRLTPICIHPPLPECRG